jgi:hypothetical protein
MDIYTNINNGRYDYPKYPPTSLKADATTCDCGVWYSNQSIPNYCSNCGKPIKDLFNKRLEEFKQMRAEYRKQCYEVDAQFKKDLLEHYGITDHPRADRAFEIAWEYGHSDGYESVALVMDDLVELMT